MAVTAGALLPEGTRVRIRRGALPVDASVVGRSGVVVDSSEYRTNNYGVQLDGERQMRMFAPAELEVVEALGLPADREEAKKRRALP
jgi:hypothetical protein